MADWQTILIDGHARAVRGFVSGFVGDRNVAPDQVLFAEDVGVPPESLGERLLELVAAGRHHLTLVAAPLADALAESLARAGGAAGVRAAERHRVVRACQPFAAETFSRDVAARVRAVVRALPAGVTFASHSEHEETHAGAEGVELYAPDHAYEYRAEGRLVGPVDGVVAVRRALEAIDGVRVDGLELELA